MFINIIIFIFIYRGKTQSNMNESKSYGEVQWRRNLTSRKRKGGGTFVPFNNMKGGKK